MLVLEGTLTVVFITRTVPKGGVLVFPRDLMLFERNLDVAPAVVMSSSGFDSQLPARRSSHTHTQVIERIHGASKRAVGHGAFMASVACSSVDRSKVSLLSFIRSLVFHVRYLALKPISLQTLGSPSKIGSVSPHRPQHTHRMRVHFTPDPPPRKNS
jgi:hypothetical protein